MALEKMHLFFLELRAKTPWPSNHIAKIAQKKLYSQKTQSQLQHSFKTFQNPHQPVEETKVPAKARDYKVIERKQMQSGTHIDRQQ